MTAAYTYLLTDLATGVIRDAIRLSDVSVETVLNRRGGLAAKVSRRAATTTRSLLTENTTGLIVLRNDNVLWGGIVQAIQAKSGQGWLDLGCVGFLDYYDHRVLRETRKYAQVDQATIITDLVAYTTAQASLTYGSTVGPGEGIPMLRSAEATGILRDRTYDGAGRPFVGDLIRKVTDVEGGPDVAVVTSAVVDGNGARSFVNTFTVWGQKGGNAGAVVRYGPGVEYTLTYSGEQQQNRVDAMNDADSTERLIANVSAGGVIAFDGVISRPGVTDPATLTSWATRIAAIYGSPLVLPAVELTNPVETPPGAIVDGDQVRLIIADGYVQEDSTQRVVATKVTIGSGGSERLDLAFAPPAVTGGIAA